MMLSIRDVNESVYKEFKVFAVKKEMTIGEALTEAMQMLMERKEKQVSFLEVKPSRWGKGTEKTSLEIDKYAY